MLFLFIGVSRKVRASGTHLFLPEIKGVGVLRQRYPIFPVHGEGSSVWKEVNALKVREVRALLHMRPLCIRFIQVTYVMNGT